MELEGIVHDGVIVPDDAQVLVEGTRVRIEPVKTAPGQPAPMTHYELFRDVIGKAAELPEDMAKNHNHYIRGGPHQ